MKQYLIITKWTKRVVFRTSERWLALHWLENNNDPDVFKMVRA